MNIDNSLVEILGYNYAYVTSCLGIINKKIVDDKELSDTELLLFLYDDILNEISKTTVTDFLENSKNKQDLIDVEVAFNYFGLEDFYHRLITDTHGLSLGMDRPPEKGKIFSDISLRKDSRMAMDKIAPKIVPIFDGYNPK